MKKIVTVIMAVLMMMSVVTGASAATNSPFKPSTPDISISKTSISVKSLTYNGKAQTLSGKVTVKVNTNYGVITLREGKDYKLVYTKGKNAGTYKVTVKGIGAYKSGTFNKTYKINKANNKISAKASKSTVKYSKKKATTVTVKASGQGKKTYSTASTSKSLRKYISVNSKGKVTLKKGAKKGTYKVTVKYAGNGNYKAGTKTITIRVK